ncbi:MAG: hypothetical protein Q9187_002733 [Circinaria calcarea]
MLYGKNGTVYVAARSAERSNVGIKNIEAAHPKSRGKLMIMVLDLADLSTVKPAVEKFLAIEDRLHVLVHNAAVMMPPVGSKTKLGHDLEMGTNCLGPFLLNKLLEDVLRRTAASKMTPSNTVRSVWVSSVVQTGPPKGGVQFDENGNPKQFKAMENYMQSKSGDVFLASEFAKRLGNDGILSVVGGLVPVTKPRLTRLESAPGLDDDGAAKTSACDTTSCYGMVQETDDTAEFHNPDNPIL